MIKIIGLHHIAIICSDYKKSKEFYTEILGFTILKEVYRKKRQSYKLDLKLGDNYLIELFSFPETPIRQSRPEAAGLRHIAFKVANIEESISLLNQLGIETEPIRVDAYTAKKFTFFQDPDNLPIELYET